MKLRMPQACENCPFSQTEAGLRLRESLEPRRWVGILKGVLAGRHFLCHKTTTETGNGTALVCAGAIETAAAHGVKADLVQVMERLEQYAAERTRPAGPEA